jgi:hypothetical protein
VKARQLGADALELAHEHVRERAGLAEVSSPSSRFESLQDVARDRCAQHSDGTLESMGRALDRFRITGLHRGAEGGELLGDLVER